MQITRLTAACGCVGLMFSLAACGSSGLSLSYRQGWDKAVTEVGTDCNAVPRGVSSRSDWTRGCQTASGFMSLHFGGGRPTSTPTTYTGDP
jgi:hypothetical protein